MDSIGMMIPGRSYLSGQELEKFATYLRQYVVVPKIAARGRRPSGGIIFDGIKDALEVAFGLLAAKEQFDILRTIAEEQFGKDTLDICFFGARSAERSRHLRNVPQAPRCQEGRGPKLVSRGPAERSRHVRNVPQAPVPHLRSGGDEPEVVDLTRMDAWSSGSEDERRRHLRKRTRLC